MLSTKEAAAQPWSLAPYCEPCCSLLGQRLRQQWEKVYAAEAVGAIRIQAEVEVSVSTHTVCSAGTLRVNGILQP